MDSRPMAGPVVFCRHTGVADSIVCDHSGAVERTGYLPFCCRLRRNGPSLARHDSRLWRPRAIRSVQDTVYCGAHRFSGGVCLGFAL